MVQMGNYQIKVVIRETCQQVKQGGGVGAPRKRDDQSIARPEEELLANRSLYTRYEREVGGDHRLDGAMAK
jgi:hypothetical protein